MPQIGGLLAAVNWGTIAVKAAFGLATAVVGKIFSSKKKTGASSIESRDARQKQNITDTAASIPIAYGFCKVGGIRVYATTALAYTATENVEGSTIDTRGDYLCLVNALCLGEIEAIDTIYLDNIDQTDAQFQTPYKLDLTLNWTYTRPPAPPAQTYPTGVISGSVIKEPPYGYYLVRIDKNTGKEETIFSEFSLTSTNIVSASNLTNRTITSPYTIYNTQYGDYDFKLYYLKYTGETELVGNATISAGYTSFSQTVDNNLTITANSRQEGMYLASRYRLGGADNAEAVPAWIFPAETGYSTNRKGWDVAYVAHRLLKHTKGYTLPDKNVFNNIPTVSALVYGTKVYDPRTDITDYSNNPALCLLDYLLRDGIDINKIDLDSFSDGADYCDLKNWTLNGVVLTENTVSDNIQEMLSCFNAKLNKITGIYVLKIMKAEATSAVFDQSVIIGNVSLSNQGIRGKQNKIKVQWMDPSIQFQSNFIEISSEAFLAQDKGKEYKLDLELPYVTNQQQAYELGVQYLKQSRLGLAVTLTTDLTTYETSIGDVIELDYPPFNFNNKKFRVESIEAVNDDTNGVVLNYVLREYDDAVYTSEDIEFFSPETGITLDNPFKISPPSDIRYNQTFEIDSMGYHVPITKLYWTPSQTINISNYQIDYKPYSNGEWIFGGYSNTCGFNLKSLITGHYLVRIKAINSLGVESEYAEKQIDVYLPTDIPPDVNNFELKNNNKTVTLSWSVIPEIALNGFYLLKHIPNTNITASWLDIPTWQQIIQGTQTEVTVSQIDGTYMIKAVNLAGIESNNEARIVLDLPDDTDWQTVETIQEAPDWTGTKTHMVETDNKLLLDGFTYFDDATGLFDSAEGFFDYGINGSNNLGVYEFAQEFDLGGIYKIKLKKNIQANISLASLNFDQAEGLFDDRVGFFDGEISTSGTGINTLYSVSRDGVSYGDWKLLTENEETAKNIKIKLEVFANSTDTQIEIEEASVICQLKSRVEQKRVLINSSAKQINFDFAFYSLTGISIAIDNPATGDYYTITDKTETGFKITVYNNSNSVVTDRYITYIATGLGEKL